MSFSTCHDTNGGVESSAYVGRFLLQATLVTQQNSNRWHLSRVKE